MARNAWDRYGEQMDGDARPAEGLTIINPADLWDKPIPERRWIVQGWLPCGSTTLLYGDGGTGKTLLAQQLMTSAAAGLPWCGLAVERCKSFALFCEDDEDELHRRQEQINIHMGIDYRRLADMRWVSGVGQDNVLVRFDGDGLASATPLMEEITREASDFRAKVVVIDTAADVFGGNENDRQQVRQFIGRYLNKLAREIEGAVLLNAHPSRSGMSANGDVDGGSTAWSNTARSRWSLSRPAPEGDDVAYPNARILTRRKANYASIGDTVKLRWANGVLLEPASAQGGFTAATARQAAEAVFLELLDKCTESGIRLHPSRTAGMWAPKILAARPDAQGYTRKEFEAAMSRLFASRQIRLIEYGRKGDARHKIARMPVAAPGIEEDMLAEAAA